MPRTDDDLAETLLEAEDLHLMRDGRRVVQGYSLRLARGEILGLLGANGAGKTSTLALLAGVHPPQQGRIRIAGHDLQTAPMAARRHLGFLPDRPPLYDELTVTEYLELAATLRRLPRTGRRAAVERAIERCGLGKVRRRLIGQLSLGYRQRVGLAQAIVHEPEVILLDEPTSALDPVQVRSIRALVRALGREHAVILSSHLLPEVEAVCTRVQILHAGRVVHEQPLPAEGGDHRLETAEPVDAARLGGIAGIAQVRTESATRFGLRLNAPPERVLDALHAAGIPVRAFCPATGGLEQVFLEQVLKREGRAA